MSNNSNNNNNNASPTGPPPIRPPYPHGLSATPIKSQSAAVGVKLPAKATNATATGAAPGTSHPLVHDIENCVTVKTPPGVTSEQVLVALDKHYPSLAGPMPCTIKGQSALRFPKTANLDDLAANGLTVDRTFCQVEKLLTPSEGGVIQCNLTGFLDPEGVRLFDEEIAAFGTVLVRRIQYVGKTKHISGVYHFRLALKDPSKLPPPSIILERDGRTIKERLIVGLSDDGESVSEEQEGKGTLSRVTGGLCHCVFCRSATHIRKDCTVAPLCKICSQQSHATQHCPCRHAAGSQGSQPLRASPAAPENAVAHTTGDLQRDALAERRLQRHRNVCDLEDETGDDDDDDDEGDDEDEGGESEVETTTMSKGYAFYLHVRRDMYSIAHRLRRLFCAFVIDGWASAENDRLSYIVNHQEEMRLTSRAAIEDAMARGIPAEQLGQSDILASTIASGPRNVTQRFRDALRLPLRLFERFFDAVRGQGLIALAVASSGVALLLLKGGRRAHATFRIPLNSTDTSSCSVEKESDLANLLRAALLIIWDEALMAHPATPLRPSIACYATFATRTNVFARRPQGDRDQVGRATIANSPFWPSLRILELGKNMRLLLRAQDMTAEENARARRFSHWLLAVGDGSANEKGGSQVKIPDGSLLPEHERSRAGLIAFVYDGLELDSINAGLLTMVPGDVSEYRSADDTAEAANGLDDGLLGALLSPEHLNTLDVRNSPPHLLKIKVGTPVILLRNVDPEAGLCNGTRLLISRAMSRVLDA
ncbi:BQ2448_6193 [Microbotryum intermedium]|uniref:ATP-dependent DNA helicase n=1 Tax=Microbotryum intermedium TaxID=269621 RepID=A0A238FP32_9BASI|nr:BQ2448_6193 [Microbotryum intermedium]